MLRKLSGWVAQSKHGSSSLSFLLRSPAPQDSDAVVDVVDTWAAASLPTDLILEIFLRLEPAAIICCAAVCKSWRRAIIDNASIIGTHLDRFFGPSLLLGIFQSFHCDRTAAGLIRMPGPFLSALPSNSGGGNMTPANSLIPAAVSTALPTLLWYSDGFILLRTYSGGGGGSIIVYWLVILFDEDVTSDRTCLFAMDMRTERTWTTEVPKDCDMDRCHPCEFVLATSEDGRQLYLMASQSNAGRQQIEVWPCGCSPSATGGGGRCSGRWTCRAAGSFIPNRPNWEQVLLLFFCPRSGCLLAIAGDHSGLRQQFLVGVEDGSPPPRQIGTVTDDSDSFFMIQYEMDWSTYISKLK